MNQNKNKPDPQRSKWSNFLDGLGVLITLGFIGTMIIGFSDLGAGSSYFAVGVMLLLVPIFAVLSLIFIVGTVVDVVKRKSKPSGARRLFNSISMLAAIITLLFTGTSLVQWWVIAPMESTKQNEESPAIKRLTEANDKAETELYALENIEKHITKEKAVALLNSCQVSDFYYTNQTAKEDGNWGEYSTTGVALTVNDFRTLPNSISIADKLIPELVPVAKNSLKYCDELVIWNDGERFDEKNE